MTGNAQPFAFWINPSVRESPIMIKGLPLVKTLRVIDSSNHRHIPIKENAYVAICHDARSVGEVFIVRHELRFRHQNTVIIRADENNSESKAE